MSKLYVVPTPIGNLDDITLRAVRVLSDVDLILAEDTRTTQVLLRHLGIEKRMWSHHKFNEHSAVEAVARTIESGEAVALVSDAGTPGISDPGFLLVRTCLEHGIEIETLPGATAFVPALVDSGFPCDRFCFEGFLPAKKGRTKRLLQLADEERTMIFYESPYRLTKTLERRWGFSDPNVRFGIARAEPRSSSRRFGVRSPKWRPILPRTSPKGEIVVVLGGRPRREAGADGPAASGRDSADINSMGL